MPDFVLFTFLFFLFFFFRGGGGGGGRGRKQLIIGPIPLRVHTPLTVTPITTFKPLKSRRVHTGRCRAC